MTFILVKILTRKSARVGQVGGQVGEDRRACSARGKLNGEVARHADFRACHGTPTSALGSYSAVVGEDVRVAVGVCPMEFQLPARPITLFVVRAVRGFAESPNAWRKLTDSASEHWQ